MRWGAVRAVVLMLAMVIGAAWPSAARGQVNIATCIWDSGAFDNRTAQWSLASPYQAGEQQTADDFYLPEGSVYRLDKFTATLVGDSIIPKARLKLYEDCNGMPGALLLTMESSAMVDTGAVHAGLRVFRAEFTPAALWLPGNRAYWVSVMGVLVQPTDQWWWGTAGNGNVVGLPGRYRAVNAGVLDWVSVATLGCGCTDFAMKIEGEACKVLWDNGGPDAVAGGASSMDAGTLIRSRSADDFVVPPCADVTVCFVRAVIYSNCVPVRGRIEVHANACNLPLDPAIVGAPFSRSIDLGYSVTIAGVSLRAYEVQVYGVNWVLTAGKTYWLAVIGESEGTLGAKTYFAYANRCGACTTQLNSAASAGLALNLPAWARASQVSGVTRDLSFLLAVKPAAQQQAQPTCAADFNRDGSLNISDLFAYLAAWFNGCH